MDSTLYPHHPAAAHLDHLESHSVFVLREIAGECDRPVLLFSGGKDSAVLCHLAQKAFYPSPIPFPLLQVDTGHNFPEVLEFRDVRAKELDCELIVASVQEAIDKGLVKDPGEGESRNRLQSAVLLDVIARQGFDACIGGARRDEDKARAKERVVSLRSRFGQWEPRHQRPELWSIYYGKVNPGEHLRVFPLSDWTELDIWLYIQREQIELPNIYYAHRRLVLERDGMLLAHSPYLTARAGEKVFEETVRFRTVGDMTCTAAIRSRAMTPAEVIEEIMTFQVSERGASRADDRFSEVAMEERKREGYF